MLKKIAVDAVAATDPTDLRIGTVVSAAPLKVSINIQMDALGADLLLLTSAVVEKKIPVLSHTHTIPQARTSAATVGDSSHSHTVPAGETGAALGSVACLENGVPLPVQDGYIILNRGLSVGDKVLLLRVQSGQKFIVLSRVF